MSKIDAILEHNKIAKKKSGEILIMPNDEVKEFIYLAEGYVREYFVNTDGDEVTLHIFRPGALFPLVALNSKSPNRYYFETLSPCKVARIDRTVVESKIENDIEFTQELLMRFLGAVNGFCLRVEQLAFSTPHQKIMYAFEFLARHFGEVTDDYFKINRKFTHREIASFAALSRETVSRTISDLKKAEILMEQNGMIVVCRQ